MNCEHCYPLLLDQLYGLLDGPEAAAVDEHLATCPACAEARIETARVQGLIARAAKSTFPNTRFEPPAPATAGGSTASPAPTPVQAPAPAPVPTAMGARGQGRTLRVSRVLAWAVAAAVLIAVPGTVVPVLSILDRADAANRDAQAARQKADDAVGAVETAWHRRVLGLNDAGLKLTVAEQTQASLLNKWVSAQTEAVQADANRKLVVEVRKPATVQPGAANDFLVVVRDGRELWETAGKRMVAEIHAVDASDAVIFSQSLDPERKGDTHALRLPAAAWTQVKPNAELYLVVAQVDEKTQARTELQERVRLAGPAFATLLTTDKATYRPGERLFFRSLTLDRVTFRPPNREQTLRYELHRPDHRIVPGLNATGTTGLVRVSGEGRVDPVRTADGQPIRGVGCGEFVLPEDLADGEYTLVLREQDPSGATPTVPMPVTRTVTVRAGAPDICGKQIGFQAVSFAPGQTVEAWADLKFQDKPLPGAAITAVTAQADGKRLDGVEAPKETDQDGRARIRFRLPAGVLDGDVWLRVAFRTPLGSEEAVAKRVPVVGNRLKIEFFPECGEKLVAGVPCKVYVRATTYAGQPVDIRGTITDGREELATVESLRDDRQPGANRGLAVFTYTPKLGRAWLKLDSPTGVYTPILTSGPVPNSAVALCGGLGALATRPGFQLPESVSDGVVMSVLDPITAPGTPIRVRLHTVGRARSLVIGAYTRGHLSDTQKVVVEPELPQIVRLMAGPDPRGGVVRVTAFEVPPEAPGEPKPDLIPVAERLVFRKPGEALKLQYAIRNAAPAPPLPAGTFRAGAAVNLSITATDEKDAPAAAVLWAAAVNTGVAPGPKDRLMPTHFLLAGEVKNPDDLEYADFLLTDEPKAGESLDLLLGTQGWRRFAEQSLPPQARVQPHTPDVSRLLVQSGQYATWAEPVQVRDQRKLFETFAPRYESAVRAVVQAKTELDAVHETARDTTEIERTAAVAETAKQNADKKAADAVAARVPVQQFRSGVWYGVGGLAALALCCGGLALARTSGRFPLGFSTLGAIGLAAFLVVAAGRGDDAAARTAGHNGSVPQETDGGSAMHLADVARVHESGADARVFDHVPVPTAAPGAPQMMKKSENIAGEITKDQPSAAAAANPNFGGAGAGGSAPGKGGGPVTPNPPKDIRPHAMSPMQTGPGARPFAQPAGPPPGGGPAGPGGRPGGVSAGEPPPVAGGGYSPPVVPLVGRPAPKVGIAQAPAPAAMSGNTKPMGADSATTGDFHMMAPAATEPQRSLNRNAPVAERKEDLKRDGDWAAKYANDRANTLAPAVGAYLAVAGKPPASVAVQRYAAQQVRVITAPVPPLVVREYAAPRLEPTSLPDASALDTVLWQPVIVLPADGTAALNFNLGNSPGGYQLVIAGHTSDGRLGATRGVVTIVPSPTPVPIEPAAPAGAVPPAAPVAPARP